MLSRVGSRVGTVPRPVDWRLGTLVAWYTLFLIVYLTVETGFLSLLPDVLYWPLRLLPDALIFLLALAVILVGDRSARTLPVRLLWVVGVVCLALVVGNAARSIEVVDSINALRVLVRYLILGLLLWWAIEQDRTGRLAAIGPMTIRAIIAAGVVQIVIVLVEIVGRLLPVLRGELTSTPSTLLFLHGSLARYDQLGLWLAIVVIAALSARGTLSLGRVGLLAVCLGLLYLTTTRQAMVAVAVVASMTALVLSSGFLRRIGAVIVAIVAVVFIALTPTRLPPPPAPDTDSVGPSEPGPLEPAPVGHKSLLEISIDPKKNFRLFYNLDVAPWAALTEPLFGFGPGQQVAEHPDPRLEQHFEQAGITWAEARSYTNDSNYAGLIVQFGPIFSGVFLALLGFLGFQTARAAVHRHDEFAIASLLLASLVLVAAAFGPAFEIRQTSVVLWTCLMTATATARRLATS